MRDMVNHPPHYQSQNGLEAIDVIEAFTAGLEGIEAVDTANAIKYILRWKNKNGVEDLKKARWYIEHLISKLIVEEAKLEHAKNTNTYMGELLSENDFKFRQSFRQSHDDIE